MVALQHHLQAARSSAVSCRAQQQQAAPPAPAQPQQPAIASRRRALAAAVALPAAAAVAAWPRPAAAAVDVAAEAAAAADAVADGVPAAQALDVLSWPQWVDRTFSFSYPPGWKELDPGFAAPPPARPGSDQVSENLLKAAVRSPDGRTSIDVVVRQSTAIKRTFTSVTDIKLLGDSKEVARLLLPPGATVLATETLAVEQPPRDTGTVLGVIQRDPVTYYCYEVLLPDRTHLQLTAAAQLGRIFVLAATAADADWAAVGPALRETALSFRLRYKTFN